LFCSGSVASVASADGHLLEVGDPVGRHSLALGGGGEVLAIFRAGREFSFWDDLASVIIELVDDWPLGILVLEGQSGFRGPRKLTLGLESILELVDDRPCRTEVPVVGLNLAGRLEGALRPQMVLKGSNDVAAASGERLVLGLGLRLVGQGGSGQAQAGGPAEVGSWLATMAEEFHFCDTFTLTISEETR